MYRTSMFSVSSLRRDSISVIGRQSVPWDPLRPIAPSWPEVKEGTGVGRAPQNASDMISGSWIPDAVLGSSPPKRKGRVEHSKGVLLVMSKGINEAWQTLDSGPQAVWSSKLGIQMKSSSDPPYRKVLEGKGMFLLK